MMGGNTHIDIKPARTQADIESAALLMMAYAEWLGIDLTFQDFESEMESLPGQYSPPKGEILLATTQEGIAVGCVALRPMVSEGCCEMKRLYVAPTVRGAGVGKRLVSSILDVASNCKYHEIKLDSLSCLTQAIELYKLFGFTATDRYNNTPFEDTVFMSRKLPV